MALVRHIHKAGSELTPEERAAKWTRLDEAAKRPINYTKDCPQLTDEQLAEFRPANGMTWEERAQAIRADRTTAPDAVPAEALVNTP
ncbi:hypothetical protein AGMMS4952_08070 [Spirochaetia bacterium]|nr:hypothetical protein AGMMS4952_08070 [Spirochaetia bacterium]